MTYGRFFEKNKSSGLVQGATAIIINKLLLEQNLAKRIQEREALDTDFWDWLLGLWPKSGATQDGQLSASVPIDCVMDYYRLCNDFQS